MYEQIIDWILSVPQTIASFGSWLTSPINERFLNISPLALLGVAGVGTIITIIGIHVLRLFV